MRCDTMRCVIVRCGLTITNALPHSTFLKRKGGLFKKAHELSVLCSVDVAVIIFGNNKKLYEYSSNDMRDLITRYTYVRGDHPCPAANYFVAICTDWWKFV